MLAFVLFVVAVLNVFICEASPWFFKIKKIERSSSAQEIKKKSDDSFVSNVVVPPRLSIMIPSPDSFKYSFSQSPHTLNNTPRTLNTTPSTLNNTPRVYTPSQPIPIPHTKESQERIQSELSLKQLVDYEQISASDSSAASSIENSGGLFDMSYEPELAEIRKLKEESKIERKKLKKKTKEELNLKGTRPESPTFGLFYTEDEVSELEEFSRNHRPKSRHMGPAIQENEDEYDVDDDSDFGSNAKQECYSLSF